MPVRRLRSIAFVALFLCACAAEADTVLWGSSADPHAAAGLYTIAAGDGAAVPVGPGSAGGVSALALDPQSGTLYGILGSACDGATLVTVDQDTGALTVIGVLQGSGFDGTPGPHCRGGADALAFGRDGTLYAGGWNGGTKGGKLLTVDKATGAVIASRPTEALKKGKEPVKITGLATAPDGRLWTSHGGAAAAVLHTVDPQTGRFTSRLKLSDENAAVTGLAFGPDGTLYGAVKDGKKLASIETDGKHRGKVRIVGRFGDGVRIAGLQLLGVRVLASDCTAARGGCNPTDGQALVLPDTLAIPPDATITQHTLFITDPRVASGRCGKDPLVLFEDDPRIPDLIIPEYLCGSPDFVVLRTRSDLLLTQGTVIATNEPEAFFADALPCATPITGDPQQQDVMVWQPTDSADIEEGHALELTFECGSSRGRTRGLSWYVVGLHIDFGLDWSTQPDAVRQAFVDLTSVKFHGLVQAVVNAKGVLPKKYFKKLLESVTRASEAHEQGRYHLASREMANFIHLVERACFEPSNFNHHGNVEMRAHNVRFMLDEKVIGIMP